MDNEMASSSAQPHVRRMATGYYCRACDKSIVYPLGDSGIEKCVNCDATDLTPLSAHRVTDENGKEYGGLLVRLTAVVDRERRFDTTPLVLENNLDYYWLELWHSQILESANISKMKITDDDVRNELTCSICLEPFSADQFVGKTHCGHAFHNSCIAEWLAIRTSCPYCRSHIEIPPEEDIF